MPVHIVCLFTPTCMSADMALLWITCCFWTDASP